MVVLPLDSSKNVMYQVDVVVMDDYGNVIIRPEDSNLYGAIEITDFKVAVSYDFPIGEFVVYEPGEFKIHKDVIFETVLIPSSRSYLWCDNKGKVIYYKGTWPKLLQH
jgi:hypothetical protein